jgi:hypothetical protein
VPVSGLLVEEPSSVVTIDGAAFRKPGHAGIRTYSGADIAVLSSSFLGHSDHYHHYAIPGDALGGFGVVADSDITVEYSAFEEFFVPGTGLAEAVAIRAIANLDVDFSVFKNCELGVSWTNRKVASSLAVADNTFGMDTTVTGSTRGLVVEDFSGSGSGTVTVYGDTFEEFNDRGTLVASKIPTTISYNSFLDAGTYSSNEAFPLLSR